MRERDSILESRFGSPFLFPYIQIESNPAHPHATHHAGSSLNWSTAFASIKPLPKKLQWSFSKRSVYVYEVYIE